jgi:hypothetical protein
MSRPLCDIADDINTHWHRVNFAAAPYLNAMCYLTSIHDNFGADSARSIVLYFLSNASTWKGPEARRIKNELKALLKERTS